MVKTLLVVDYSNSSVHLSVSLPLLILISDYYQIFGKAKLSNGEEIKVEQAEWKDISIQFSHSSNEKYDGVTAYLRKSENPFPFSTQKEGQSKRLNKEPHCFLSVE